MALLKEDSQFTHVIAIDFGTGASGLVKKKIFFEKFKGVVI